MDPQQRRSWLSMLLLGISIILIFHLVSRIDRIFEWFSTFTWAFAPFLWGFMLAYALNIPREALARLLERVHNPFIRRHIKGISVALIYILFLLFIFVLAQLVLPRIYVAIVDFITFLPEMVDSIIAFLLERIDTGDLPFLDIHDFLHSFSLEEIFQDIDIGDLTATITANIAAAFGTIMSFTGFVFRLALALISSVYFLVESEKVSAFFKRLIKAIMTPVVYKSFLKYSKNLNQYFKGYIYCQVIDAFILGTLATIVLAILGAEYAFALGPILGVANLVPYFGAIIASIAAIVVILVTDGVALGIISAIVLVILQQIDANFIMPKLLGGSMKISPLLVIMGVAIGNHYYGLIGIILATPIVALSKQIIEDLLGFIERKKRQEGRFENEESV